MTRANIERRGYKRATGARPYLSRPPGGAEPSPANMALLRRQLVRLKVLQLEGRVAELRARPDWRRSEGQKFNIYELEKELEAARRALSRVVPATDATSYVFPGPASIAVTRVGQRAVGRRGRARVEDSWHLVVEGAHCLEGTRRQMMAAGHRAFQDAPMLERAAELEAGLPRRAKSGRHDA